MKGRKNVPAGSAHEAAGGSMAPAPGIQADSAGPEPAGAAPPGTNPEVEGAAAPEAVLAGLRADLERARAREDELLRALAELTNVQKRRRQEMDQALQYAAEPLLRELLPVLDDLERALAALEGRDDDPLRRGVVLVQDRLRRTLEREGLEAIRPRGAAFDPGLHDALLQRPAPGVAPNTVIEVVKPGYRYRGRVLRHAQVVVSGEPGQEAAPGGPQAAAPGPPAHKEERT